MRFLLLIPIIAYVVLITFNMNLLSQSGVINFFQLATFQGSPLLYSSIFFVIYAIILFIVLDSVGSIKNRKIRGLENEVFELKSKLYDEREDELVVFMKEHRNKLDNFLQQQEANLEKIKAENENVLLKQKVESDRIIDKLGLVDKTVLEKIKESFKPKN